MGGCTITRVADTLNQLFSDMENQILNAASCGLMADAELIVLDPSKGEGRVFKINLVSSDRPFHPPYSGVEFEEVNEGRAFHVGVAGRFGPKPEKGQLVGTVHVHT